jgi:hypothetical protein
MRDRLRAAKSETFTPADAYRADVDGLWSRIHRFDKLERVQHFRQPENPSWRAFAAGRWRESLELTEQSRPKVAAEFAEETRLGYRSYRVRVVERPITPYVQWEMHRFTVRANYGENIRIVSPEDVAPFEKHGMLPELIFLGSLAMYEILYDEDGVLVGGRKYTEPDVVAACWSDVRLIYDRGEDFRSFFAREVVPLPPPVGEPELSGSASSTTS